jgi:hypothetical protein
MLNKRAFIALAAAFALMIGVTAVTPAFAAGPELNATITGLALRGYDPVAYFTDGKPVPGDFTITARHEGRPIVSPRRTIRPSSRRTRPSICRNMAASAPSARPKATRSTATRMFGQSSKGSFISTLLPLWLFAGARISAAT